MELKFPLDIRRRPKPVAPRDQEIDGLHVIIFMLVILVIALAYGIFRTAVHGPITKCEHAIALGRQGYVQEACVPAYDHFIDLETGKIIKK